MTFGRVLRCKDSTYLQSLVLLIEEHEHTAVGMVIDEGRGGVVLSPFGRMMGPIAPLGSVLPLNLGSPFWARWDEAEECWYGGARP